MPGNWAAMYSGAYREGVRLRVVGAPALDREERKCEASLRDPYLANLGIGAWLQGIRDGRAGDAPRIDLLPDDL